MSGPSTVAELLELGERVLKDSTHIFEDHDRRGEAEELLAFCLDVEPDDLDHELVPPKALRERYLSLVARRAGGEPFPFLTGEITFYGLPLKVRPGAFVPRPSSELTVARAARRLRRRREPVIVDLATGAGPIALAIADEFPDAEVWGTDISEEGLGLGRVNARRLDIANVRFRRGDMYRPLPRRLRGALDLITGHIPYVPPDEVDDLPTEVKGYEPADTLTDYSKDGLELMRKAVFGAREWLKPGGWLLLEMSEDLPGKIRRMVKNAGLVDHGIASDADRLSVVVEARAPGRQAPKRAPA